MKKKVYVLFGGKTGEHDVSVSSAVNVLNELNKELYDVFALYITRDGIWTRPWQMNGQEVTEAAVLRTSPLSQTHSILELLLSINDENSIVFPVMHGTFGEDGKLQGLLEMMNIAYVGNGVAASAVAMDKVLAKKVFSCHSIPQAAFIAFQEDEYKRNPYGCLQRATEEIGYPCYVKPANMGSSIGITRCLSRADLEGAIMAAFQYDYKILIEEEIQGKEVLVALTGNQMIRCSMAGEWKREASFFGYEDKYMDAGLTPIIPADISDDIYLKMCEYAKEAYRALGCTGMLRADFFITENQSIYLNEVNTIPGFTKHSMFPLLVQASENCSYSEVLDQLIKLGALQFKKMDTLHYQQLDRKQLGGTQL
ncbi:D-alanine--D-alanine ligase family protein [Bacillus sp. 1P06AnD]|uniref:D-alanine--D-alanine ligase family protein n=1 Tax=Bacillus sp. 1P06AnD TaxID=3132208 RepID=UPI00399F77A1